MHSSIMEDISLEWNPLTDLRAVPPKGWLASAILDVSHFYGLQND